MGGLELSEGHDFQGRFCSTVPLACLLIGNQVAFGNIGFEISMYWRCGGLEDVMKM